MPNTLTSYPTIAGLELQHRYELLFEAQVKLRRLGADQLAEAVGQIMDDTLQALKEHGINCDQWGSNVLPYGGSGEEERVSGNR